MDSGRMIMSQDEQTSCSAIGVGCLIVLISSMAGGALGYSFMPEYRGMDLYMGVLLWCGGGFLFGVVVGVFFSWRVALWIDKPKR
jgi:hypothetical protein